MSVRLNRHAMELLQGKARVEGDLLVWVIYDHPRDFPDTYVVRPHSTKLGKPLTVHFDDSQLEAVRSVMRRMGLQRLPRAPSDDNSILETWV